MLHRIDVAVFDVPRVVRFVTDEMLTEAALPDAALVTRDTNSTEPFRLR